MTLCLVVNDHKNNILIVDDHPFIIQGYKMLPHATY
jgi:hypothetical protein